MMESECYEIDLELASMMTSTDEHVASEIFQKYITDLQTIKSLERSIETYNEQISLIADVVISQIADTPEREDEIKTIYDPRTEYLNKRKEEKILNLKDYESTQFKMEDGLCSKRLDDILKSKNVERQAYHGKSFIGNHVHKMLKSGSIKDLCQSIPNLITELGFQEKEVYRKSILLQENYSLLFTKYAKCHFTINSKEEFDADKILTLRKHIDDFMDHFRKNWPSATIPPKLHMLEYHAVEFVEKWGTAFGIYGEQGAETLHNEFNKLEEYTEEGRKNILCNETKHKKIRRHDERTL